MKRIEIAGLVLSLALVSCSDRTLKTFTANVPVYMSYDALRSPVEVTAGRELEKPGKIYFKDSLMFLNEYRQGIHVVDLSDASDPQQVAFIDIPGNVDMAVRNNLLYADSYVDLVIIDIGNPNAPVEKARIEDIFEYVIPEYDTDYPVDEIDEDKGVVTGFKIKEITREVENYYYPGPIFYAYDAVSVRAEVSGTAGNGNSYGVGGSMARFLTYDDYLYSLESDYKLKTIQISGEEPEVTSEQYLWGNVETLFIADKYLYVGSSSGLFIMSLEEPSMPEKISSYRHVTACDPVVVSGNRAYVTLRAGNVCGGELNLLEVINVSDKYNPYKMASFSMTEPYGVGIRNGILFVCEGSYGLKVYNAADSYHITDHLIAAFEDIHAYDVIPLDGLLFLTGEDGFYIYDTSDPQDISQQSFIPVPLSAE